MRNSGNTELDRVDVGDRDLVSSVSRARRWLVSYPRAVPLAIFLAIAAITALSVFAVESNARAREEAQVREAAQSIASALQRRANSFASYLRAGAALFSTTQNIDPDTFEQFVTELRLDLDYRGAEGIGWVTVLEASQIPGFLDLQRQDQAAFPPIQPPTGDSTNLVAPVTYFFPDTKRSRRALAFDMFSDPVRKAAMDEALRMVQQTASARVSTSPEASDNAPGFVLFMPVFRRIDGGGSIDRALSGFVYSPFNASRFLDEALAQTSPGSFGVRLYDGEAQTEHLLVSRSLVNQAGTRIEQPVALANREFLLVVELPQGSTLDPISMITLIFGLTLGSLLMLLARLLTQQAFEDQTRLAFFEEQHSIRNSLTQELNHRVKNTLANVLSILSLTRRRSDNLDQFADSLEGRIRALSATHDLLTGTDWGTTPLRSVVEAELQHFRSSGENIVNIDGPPVELAPNDALSFGLAVHELATNAAKFGALSVPEGRVSIYWSQIDDGMAEVEWRELEGPELESERQRGFGTELIEKIVAHELRQPVKLEFAREGVRCVIRVPVRQRQKFQIRQ
ncbi:MAG: CHASE domain-containing protein [Pseudomonadota bacterium]